MISSRWNRREFCYAGFLALLSTKKNQTGKLRLPEPKFQIGDRVRTEQTCEDKFSENYGCIDWQSGFVIGYVWNYDEWLLKRYCQGWTYWLRIDKTNYQDYGDRPWLDFVHESEIILV